MLSAKDLLYKALDYDGFWNTKHHRKSPSSKSRKLQLEALLKAFGIMKINATAQSQVMRKADKNLEVETLYSGRGPAGWLGRIDYIKTLTDLRYFSSGEFLADLDEAAYHKLANQIKSATRTIFPVQSNIIKKEQVNLVRLFSGLYNFRLSVYLLLKYSWSRKTTGKSSIEDDYSLHLRMNFIRSATDNFSEVDEALCRMIDPQKREFSEEEIGYPDFDLEALDREAGLWPS